LKPIICHNDIKTVLNNLQEYASNGGIIKSIYLVDHTEEQVVILVSDNAITESVASIWWSGYVAALGDQPI
jgi:hypothetical protein